MTIDELIGAGAVGGAFGLPLHVGDVGFPQCLGHLGVIAQAEDFPGDVLEDGDLADPGVLSSQMI